MATVVSQMAQWWATEGVPEAVVVGLLGLCVLLVVQVVVEQRKRRGGGAASGRDALGTSIAPTALVKPRQDAEPLPAPRSHHACYTHPSVPVDLLQRRADAFCSLMLQRRSLRFFSPTPVPLSLISRCVQTAASSPSGAHCQPWTFVVVRSADVKHQIRLAVEAEEQKNYDRRMRASWVADVNPLVDDLHAGSSVQKPYLDVAPYLIIVMKQVHGGEDANGNRIPHYYPAESTGIAVGLLIAALHNANLVTLTSTPMGAESKIRKLCGRPDREKVFLLMPVGLAADNSSATVPYRKPGAERKPLAEAMVVV